MKTENSRFTRPEDRRVFSMVVFYIYSPLVLLLAAAAVV